MGPPILHSLEQAKPARIIATYTLNNRGSSREVALMFITHSGRAVSFEVKLNDESIELNAHQVNPASLPAKWRPPKSIPGLDGALIPYLPSSFRDSEIAIARFEPVILAGLNTSTAQYEAEVARYVRGGTLTDQWLLACSLTPARSWASFGQLNVTVFTSPVWLIAIELALARSGDVLTGAFSGLPADAITIATRAPESAACIIAAFVLTASLFVVLADGSLMLLRTSWRRGKVGKGVVLAALGMALLWAALVLAIGLAGVFIPPLLLPPLQANSDSYTHVLISIGVRGLAALVGWPAGASAGIVACNCSKPASSMDGR
ncbi:MAG: hypothetical protein KatS3mg053_1019 [Candidatus Roseilinea sp.]|nr:MAG: hypothetical protein KatS3mg053_1019 [Candidatus Roseilinea sp.]